MKRYIIWIASALVAVAAVVAIAARSGKSAEDQTANFTVEFHNGEIEYVINGYDTVTLSDVFANLGIESDGEISKVTFSDPSLIAVAENAGEWSLKSLAPFSTHENLSIAYADGHVLDMEVTDGVHIDVTWSPSQPDGIDAGYNVTFLGQSKPIMKFYDENNSYLGECKANDLVTAGGWFDINSPGNKYWFEVTDTDNLSLGYCVLGGDLMGASESTGQIVSFWTKPTMYVKCHSTAIKDGNGYSTKYKSEMVINSDRIYTRKFEYFIDGVKDGATITKQVPARDDEGRYAKLDAEDIKLTYDKNKYAGYSITVNEDTQTYTINLYTKYSVKFNGNGSTSGSMSNQNFVYGTAQNLTANAFEKKYTVTFNGNGGTPASSSLTASATFNGWEDRGVFNYNGTEYSYTAFDAPFYANTYSDLYAAFGYDKYKLINHYFNNGQGEGRSCVGSTPGLYPNNAQVNNLSNAPAGTVNLYANWTPGSVTLPSATRNGYAFLGWFTAAEGGTKVGGAGDTYTPAGNVTLYGQWSQETVDLTISETGLTGNDGIIVTVTASGSTKPAYVVSLDPANTSVTIKAVPVGVYDIVETSWSHAYTVDPASFNVNLNKDTEVTFVHTPKQNTPAHDESSVINWKN